MSGHNNPSGPRTTGGDNHQVVFGRNLGIDEMPLGGQKNKNGKIDDDDDDVALIDEVKTITRQVDYLRGNTHYIVAHFILECCAKLEAECVTTATACCLFHKFFSAANILEYDPYLIAATCIYLAGKVEDDHLKLRDVINVVHATLQRTNEPLSLDNEYWNIRDALVQTELFVLRMVGFQVRFAHPHKHLLHYLTSIRDWMTPADWARFPLAQTAWKLLQDLYHDAHVLTTDPSITALAMIQLVMETYGIQLPLMGSIDAGSSGSDNGSGRGRPWFRLLNKRATKEKLWEVMSRAIDVFNREAEVLDPISTRL